MKKIVLLTGILFIILCLFCGCAQPPSEDDTITIVTAGFSEYDWVKNILGDAPEDIDVFFLTESGADLHSFQPTVNDIAKILSCDILIFTGGISDAWINDVITSSPNQNRTVIELMSLLSSNEILTEQSIHHNAHNEHEHHNDQHDEHVWLSPKLAERFCVEIARVLGEKLPEYASVFQENCENYMEKLQKLDTEISKTVSEANTKTLIFADRFPFSYFANDYGLSCYAAFPGCSAESEASFETVAFLATTLKKQQLSSVVVLESSDRSLANTVIRTAGIGTVQIVSLNSLQSVSQIDAKSGVTYLNIMKNNLEALKSALN